jgi:hypothetical protein
VADTSADEVPDSGYAAVTGDAVPAVAMAADHTARREELRFVHEGFAQAPECMGEE